MCLDLFYSGLGAATLVIGMIAIAQLCLNRHRRYQHRALINQQLCQNGKQHDLHFIIGDGRFAHVRQIIQQGCAAAGSHRIPDNLRHKCGCLFSGNENGSQCAHQPMLESQASRYMSYLTKGLFLIFLCFLFSSFSLILFLS